MVNTIQVMRYSRVCASYHNFIIRELLFKRKLLNNGFKRKMKSSLQEFYRLHHGLVDRYEICVSQITTGCVHIFCDHNPILFFSIITSAIETFHQIKCCMGNTTSATCGAGIG